MTRLLREFRLIPIVLVAAAALFTLKVIGLVSQGGYTLGAGHMAKTDRERIEMRNMALNQAAGREEAPARARSWAQDLLFPDVTGSVPAKPKEGEAGKSAEGGDKAKAADDKKPKPAEPKPDPGGIPVQLDPRPLSAAERAILERLAERRQELEQRARELDVRETLLQEAERRMEQRVGELKDIEARIAAATEKKEEADRARLKGLVTMYENMKAKDAARIFDRLDLRLATEVASQINPRRMSDIMAQMSPEAAERLTVELANRGGSPAAAVAPAAGAELPKIEGRPSGS